MKTLKNTLYFYWNQIKYCVGTSKCEYNPIFEITIWIYLFSIKVASIVFFLNFYDAYN